MAAMFRPALRTCARQLCAAPLRPLAMPRVGMTSTLLRSFADYPASFKYTEDHEWIEVGTSPAKLGITDFAQNELGEIVYVEMQMEIGEEVEKGEAYAIVESVKSSNDIFAPASGKISAINEALSDDPGMLNDSAHGDGWICSIEVSEESELDSLMDSSEYGAHCDESAH